MGMLIVFSIRSIYNKDFDYRLLILLLNSLGLYININYSLEFLNRYYKNKDFPFVFIKNLKCSLLFYILMTIKHTILM